MTTLNDTFDINNTIYWHIAFGTKDDEDFAWSSKPGTFAFFVDDDEQGLFCLDEESKEWIPSEVVSDEAIAKFIQQQKSFTDSYFNSSIEDHFLESQIREAMMQEVCEFEDMTDYIATLVPFSEKWTDEYHDAFFIEIHRVDLSEQGLDLSVSFDDGKAKVVMNEKEMAMLDFFEEFDSSAWESDDATWFVAVEPK